MSPTTMHIGELARAAEVSVTIVRRYDRAGLLPPTARSDGGFRLYTDDDLPRLRMLRRMHSLGFEVTEMRELLTLLQDVSGGGGPSSPARPSPAAADDLRAFAARACERERGLRAQLQSAHELITTLQAAVARQEAGEGPDSPTRAPQGSSADHTDGTRTDHGDASSPPPSTATRRDEDD